MKIGFTGTREGMSNTQKIALGMWLEAFDTFYLSCCEFHHGDCLGADAEALIIALRQTWWEGEERVKTVCHPPDNESLRAFTFNDETRDPLPYKERNQAIVDECDILIAAPLKRPGAGGTWQTINMARKAGKTVVILDRWLE